MKTDEVLKAWRDAAQAGGLPAPDRERWQPLRAGVVNLWEFEAAEYWYADGWAQLMGRNETGKSSLMALTTLIPWLADTSSDKIDTLGRSGKQFAYYVRPTGSDGDRRDATPSFFHGWLWVEYGRRTSEDPQFFTTLLYSSARTGNQKVNLEWCTAQGSRVRDALRLVSDRDVVPPQAIEAPGFEPHPTAGLYKATVADHLLGATVDRLETIGKILKVTRTPKLGAQLDVRFVTEHLREALPELRRSEIEQLAQGWDQLEQIGADLERAREAALLVARFAQGSWRPWLGARLRLQADDATTQRTNFDRVTREELAANRTLVEAQEADDNLKRRSDAASLAAESARAAADQLRVSASYQDASARISNAHRAEEDQWTAEKARSIAEQDADRATERVEEASATHQGDADGAEAARQAVEHAVSAVRATAEGAGVPVMDDTLDPDRLRQRAIQRRQSCERALVQLRGAEEANMAAVGRERQADADQVRADEEASAAAASWGEAEAEHETLAASLAAWANEAPWPAPLVSAWVDALPRTLSDLSGATLTDTIRSEWHEPLRDELQRRRTTAEAAERASRAEAARLRDEIATLERAGVVPPASPALWRRRPRGEAQGAPLWRLLNPAPEVSGTELARVEAALAAAGLLDAWVEPGRARGLDTFAVAPDDPGAAGSRLSAILRVADDAGALGAAAQAVLDGVALSGAHEALPDAGLAVSLDGRWRNSALEGAAAPTHEAAEWLGEAARESQRRRRLAELASQAVASNEEAENHHVVVVRAGVDLERLATALRQAPSDESLRGLLHRASANDDVADRARARAERSRGVAQAERARAETARAGFLRFVNERRLPADRDDLETVVTRVRDLVDALGALRRDEADWSAANHRAERSRATLDKHRLELDQMTARHADANRRLSVARASAEAMRAAINADDQQVLDELHRLERAATQSASEASALSNERIGVSTRLATAAERLRNVEEQRRTATEARDASYRRFRVLIDRGVADDLDLTLPDPHSSTVDSVRSQVAEVRRAVSPGRQWRDGDQEANVTTLQNLRSQLELAAHDARAELEQGGRSLQLEPDGDLVRIDVTVNSNGTTQPLREAIHTLDETVTKLSDAYNARVQQTLDDLLGSTFLEHMRERIGLTENLIAKVNRVLGQHATSTSGTALRIRLEPGQNQQVLKTFRDAGALLNPEVAGQVREFLKSRVDEAKRQASDEGQADWRDALARQLDYRAWYEINLERRVGSGGNWGVLNTRSFAIMSGGARAVMLMLPLIATLAALYQDMPDAPRPLWLDEAFDGLDVPNRSMVMEVLREFDLDVLLAGPGRLVNVKAVPTAAIYQVVRAPAPVPGADLTLELWSGGSLEAIDLPLSWLDGPATDQPSDQGTLV